ncbi:MAG: outer membrane lipoprotein-sorting protein [Bdellovibrionales bacterium]|nr:outer membrane lipoprotein-sorting protein [Bdellovibrionales bacterium]
MTENARNHCCLYCRFFYKLSAVVAFLISAPIAGVADNLPSPGRPAKEWVRSAIEYWREDTSHVQASMIVHRPTWERRMSLVSWTKGMDLSLIRFTEPKKDAGSASLKRGDQLWTFSPKVNRVIKIPSSMMGQSWMGSDFSYNDLARDDDIIELYDHRFLPSEKRDGKVVYVIESVPHEGAPVVWGREVLKVRDDLVLMEHLFFDQEDILVKRLQTIEVGMLGGKIFPVRMRMENVEEKEQWTEFLHKKAEFNLSLPPDLFSVSYLKNPRFGLD